MADQDLLKDEPPHMWDYWRDKKGIEDALTDYFPRTLAGNPSSKSPSPSSRTLSSRSTRS